MRPLPLLLLALASCTSSGSDDIVGPFTGPVTRYVADGFTFPTTNHAAFDVGDDLDGNGTVDNELGQVISTLYQNADLTAHGADMIAAGAIASSLELQAEDLTRAPKAGATYYGADGDPATVVGGVISGGELVSNRTRTTQVPGMAILRLPVFDSADPSVIELDAMELDLTPDGAGGYDALVRGEVRPDALAPALCLGIQQMIYDDPQDHFQMAALFDPQRDGQITCDDIAKSSLIESLTAPDVTRSGHPMISFGFGVHFKPCDTGACVTSPPADPCHDRVQDAGETGVDCGGTCGACPVANPTCTDGVRDGLESDVDCGWNCAPCANGQHCYSNTDCASNWCGFSGTCAPKP